MNAALTARPRILLLRPDHLGDMLLTLPTAQLLRRLLPHAHITLAVAPALAALAARCPAIDAVLPINFPAPTAPDSPAGWDATARNAASTMRGHFDIALIPRLDDPWSGHLATLAEIPSRIGYAHPRTQPYLTTALLLPPRCHVVELGLTLARHVAGSAEHAPDLTPWIVPRAEDVAEVESVLASLPHADPLHGPLVAFHPGSSWQLKEWPYTRWGALIRSMCRHYDITALVTGSEHERALVSAVVAASAGSAVDLAGQLSLSGLAALYQRAVLVIAIDSGPLHLAVATGTPVVGIYGPADPLEFGPWSPPERARVIHTALPCQPCRHLANPPCGATIHPACLTGVDADTVLAAAGELLATPLSFRRLSFRR